MALNYELVHRTGNTTFSEYGTSVLILDEIDHYVDLLANQTLAVVNATNGSTLFNATFTWVHNQDTGSDSVIIQMDNDTVHYLHCDYRKDQGRKL